jgi:RNA polymerase sigma factor (sigma-70 family)
MKDNEIIESIRKGNREKPIKYLYKEFPVIRAKIMASGGNKETAEEIFNDALLLLMEKVSKPSFELSSKLSTYLFGIARFLWKNELRKQNRKQDLEWEGAVILSEEFMNMDEEREERFQALETIIASLSRKCQDIFERLYYKNQSMQEIANALGFSNENSAKTQKYKCMEQAIKQASAINLQSN